MDIETDKQDTYSNYTFLNLKYRMAARCIAQTQIVTMLGAFVYGILMAIFIGYSQMQVENPGDLFATISVVLILAGTLLFVLFVLLPFITALTLLQSTSSDDDQPLSKKTSRAKFWYLYTLFLIILATIGVIGVAVLTLFQGAAIWIVLFMVVRFGGILAAAFVPVMFVRKYITELKEST